MSRHMYECVCVCVSLATSFNLRSFKYLFKLAKEAEGERQRCFGTVSERVFLQSDHQDNMSPLFPSLDTCNIVLQFYYFSVPPR